MKDLTNDLVRELLDYDPETGFLTWRRRDREWFSTERSWKTWNTRYAGRRAGNLVTTATGYQRRVVGVFNRPRLEHHIAWMWMTDDPLPPEIDHENQNATDNRWCNLKASTRARNSRNAAMKRRNTSGVTGVSFHKLSGKWRAAFMLDGKEVYVGLFDSVSSAEIALKAARPGKDFSPRHGAQLPHYA